VGAEQVTFLVIAGLDPAIHSAIELVQALMRRVSMAARVKMTRELLWLKPVKVERNGY
jgi:hypothetical protein